MKLFDEFVFGFVVLFRPAECFGVAFIPGGVGDFCQHRCGLVLAFVPCVVKSNWIEAVAEGAEVGQYGYRTLTGVSSCSLMVAWTAFSNELIFGL